MSNLEEGWVVKLSIVWGVKVEVHIVYGGGGNDITFARVDPWMSALLSTSFVVFWEVHS